MKLTPFKNRTDKRSRILEATGCLIAECGFHGLSMAKLAKLSGVAAGTLYLYFDDKNDLIRQYYDEIHQAIAEKLFQGFDPTQTLYAQYRFLWFRARDLQLHNADYFSSKVQYEHSPFFEAQQQQQRMQTMFTPVFLMFQRGIGEGVFKPLPIPALAALSLDVIPLLVLKHQRGNYVMDEAVSELAIAACWDAICLHPNQ
ncbi:MAG: TetR/AcrR family transcriptional regulator [Motiliproteus sp.]